MGIGNWEGEEGEGIVCRYQLVVGAIDGGNGITVTLLTR